MKKLSIKKILIIELLLMFAMAGFLFAPRRTETSEALSEPVITAENPEPVTKEVDELVWTTDFADYRTEPSKDSEIAGTLYKEASVRRTGLTKNWSRIILEGETYFVPSSYLTEKSPYELAEGDKGKYQEYALSQFPKFGWDESEINALITLWDKESGWNPRAENSSSGAYGIPQSLPASKMAAEGEDYRTNPETQINWGLKYIKDRYGTPTKALDFHLEHNWY